MHEVVRGVYTDERSVERRLVEAVTLHDFGRRPDLTEPCRLPREAPDGATALFEPPKKTTANVSSGASEQNLRVHAIQLFVCRGA
jgi:hypothetical protein